MWFLWKLLHFCVPLNHFFSVFSFLWCEECHRGAGSCCQQRKQCPVFLHSIIFLALCFPLWGVLSFQRRMLFVETMTNLQEWIINSWNFQNKSTFYLFICSWETQGQMLVVIIWVATFTADSLTTLHFRQTCLRTSFFQWAGFEAWWGCCHEYLWMINCKIHIGDSSLMTEIHSDLSGTMTWETSSLSFHFPGHQHGQMTLQCILITLGKLSALKHTS